MKRRSRIKATDTLEPKSNLKLLMRERGKIVRGSRRQVHNIWLDAGRVYLAKLIAYLSLSPLTPEEDNRIRYMGVGIGGNRQNATGISGAFPLGPSGAPGGIPNGYYPGTNVQNDTTPGVTRLERPVRISSTNPGSPSTPPLYADPGEVWLGEITAPASHPVTTSTTFTRIFTENEISYGPFLVVPISEIGLFINSASSTYVHTPYNQPVAYDTFDSVSKTSAFSLEVEWTVKF